MSTIYAKTTSTSTDTASFRRMDDPSAEQWPEIGALTSKRQASAWRPRCWPSSKGWPHQTDGSRPIPARHCLQTATRAERPGADREDGGSAALVHDIGKYVSVPITPHRGGDPCAPMCVTRFSWDPHPRTSRAGTTTPLLWRPRAREPVPRPNRGSRWASGSPTSGTRRRFDPDYPTEQLAHFEPLVGGLRPPPQLLMGSRPHRATDPRASARSRRRHDATRRLSMELGQQDSVAGHGHRHFGPVLVVIASYSRPTTSATCSRQCRRR